MAGLVVNASAPTKNEINYLQASNLENLNRNKRIFSFKMNDDRYYKADFKDLSYYPILHTKFNKNFTCFTAFKTSSQQGAEKLQNQIYNNKIGLLETLNYNCKCK